VAVAFASVIGGDEDEPIFLRVLRAGAHGAEDFADVGVHQSDGVQVEAAVRRKGRSGVDGTVAKLIHLTELDKHRIRNSCASILMR
jgi:hypothetical protein